MKKLALLLIAGLSIGMGQAWAQRGMSPGNCIHDNRQSAGINRHGPQLPDLTDDQQEKIMALRVAHQKNMLPVRNSLLEKKAHLRTLTTVDKPDKKAIEVTIKEMNALHTQMQLAQTEHRLEVRGLLTDEQRIIFDTRPHGGGFGMSHKPGYDQGKGQRGLNRY